MSDIRATRQPVDNTAIVVAEKEGVGGDADADRTVLEGGFQLLRVLGLHLEVIGTHDALGVGHTVLELVILKLALLGLGLIRIFVALDDSLLFAILVRIIDEATVATVIPVGRRAVDELLDGDVE